MLGIIATFKNDISSKIKEFYNDKLLTNLYDEWQKPVYFKPPLWFRLIELLAFKKLDFSAMKEDKKIEFLNDFGKGNMSSLQYYINNKIQTSDYMLPLPKFIKNFVYSRNRRLNNNFLVLFYSNLLSIQRSGGNEPKALQKFYESPYIKPFPKKIIFDWLEILKDGDRQFHHLLKDDCKLFGEFEANFYFEANGSGRNLDILDKIISNLSDLIQLDKAMKSIKKTVLSYLLLTLAVGYYVIAYTINDLISAVGAETMPSYISNIFSLGIFLKKPIGLIVTILILLLLFITGKKLKNNQLISGLISVLPGVGDFVRFVELYLFTDALVMFYSIVEGTDDKIIGRAANVVSNSFLRGFLHYKLDILYNTGLNSETFFADNKFFGEYSEYVTIEGDMQKKLEKLSEILKFDKNSVIANLPERLKDIVYILMVSLMVVFIFMMMSVELWVTNPVNFQ